jgi:hypothetical protein
MTDLRRLALPDMPHPARCPGCGASVKTTLISEPTTPVYLCGSTPYRIVCVGPRFVAPAPMASDVVVLLDDDRHELRTLFLAMAPTVNAARLSVCHADDCELVAIDGRCLAGHDRYDVSDG